MNAKPCCPKYRPTQTPVQTPPTPAQPISQRKQQAGTTL